MQNISVANYLPYYKQNASVLAKIFSNAMFILFLFRFTLNQAICLKFPRSFLVALKVS